MNWESVGAIGTVLGSVATFLACFIALSQSRMAIKKRLELKIEYNVVTVNSPDSNHYIELSITNIGNRNAIIISTGYKVRNKSYYAHINPHIVTDGVTTPFAKHVLEPEHNIAFLYERNALIENLKREFNSCSHIKMFAMDSTGKYYYTDIQKSMIQC